MCGIIARISESTNPKNTLETLKELEYRGYDSFGLLMYNAEENTTELIKEKGNITENIINKLKLKKSNIELGHTRWATHGKVSKINAHPLCDKKKQFYVVMNGIIENYEEIKNHLEKEKNIFKSQTDTEVIPQLYNLYSKNYKTLTKNDILNITLKIIKTLKGDFSYILKYKNYVVAYKNSYPIIFGQNGKEIFLCSDLNTIQNITKTYSIMNDQEIFIAEMRNNKEINFEVINLKFDSIKKQSILSEKTNRTTNLTHNTFMEKEIYDQKCLKNAYTNDNIKTITNLIQNLKNKKLYLIGAGTSFHAALHLHYLLIQNNIESKPILASEFEYYRNNIKDSIIIAYSQSGETADLLHPLKEIKKENQIYLITNTKNSTLDRISNKSIYLNCGREISVASTKAFTAQIFVNYLINSKIKKINIEKNLQEYEKSFDSFISKNLKLIENISQKLKSSQNIFFLGKYLWYPIAIEGALKLKEISYIHAEGFAGGELKHGPLSLIKKNTPVIILGNDEITSNTAEVKTRGAMTIGLTTNKKKCKYLNYQFKIPNYFEEIFISIILQLIALKVTLNLNLNPDKPRNLAKSVTVK